MVKVELNYNPYIRETAIRFNGQKPHINSQVEKYDQVLLQNWVHTIPKIFYDEMNGYDFELDFSGTKLDYHDVANAFLEAGVTEDEVHIIHKNELNDRLIKDEQLNSLFQWMQDNANPRFDIDEFIKEHANIFDIYFPFILIHGLETDQIDFRKIKVAAEVVNQVAELDSTNLINTPILFFIDRKTLPLLQHELGVIMNRQDVEENQLFFYIHSALDQSKAKRIIQDLGIKKPQIVQSVNDDLIFKYLEIYPLSEYLFQAVSLIKTNAEEVLAELKEVQAHSSETNREIYNQIDALEGHIEKLKISHEKFISRHNLDFPEQWHTIKDNLREKILNWNIKKTKIAGEVAGASVANEFGSYVASHATRFVENLDADASKMIDAILTEYADWYSLSEVQDEFRITDIQKQDKIPPDFPDMSGVLNLKTIEYVEDKQDLRGLFLKMTNNLEPSTHPVTVFYYKQWRDYGSNTLMPSIDIYMEKYFEGLQQYLFRVAEKYETHLLELIQEYTEKKETVSANLSEEEQALQREFDWITSILNQLNEIERG